MSRQIAVRLDDDQLAALDAEVASGKFESRAEAVRAAIDRMLREEREREIAEAYRRGYGRQPQEEWVGQAGLELLEDFHRREQSKGPR